MKYIITIEETNVKDFIVETNSKEEAYKIAKEKYYSNEFVLDPGECQYRRMAVINPRNGDPEWRGF